MPGVDEMTVRLAGRTRRRVRWALAGFCGVWGGLWVAALVATLLSGTLLTILLVNGVFLMVMLSAVLVVGIPAAGSTQIGSAGLRLRGPFTKGFIAWDEVAEVKDRFHPTRGTGWWSVEAQLTTGRVRRLPGFYCQSPAPGAFSGPKRDAEFDDQLFELRHRLRQWQSA